MKKQYTKRQITEAIAYWKNQLNIGNYKGTNELMLEDTNQNAIEAISALNNTQLFNAIFDNGYQKIYLNAKDSPECKQLFDLVKNITKSPFVKKLPISANGIAEYELTDDAKTQFDKQLIAITRLIQSRTPMGIITIEIENNDEVAVIYCDKGAYPTTFGIKTY